MMTATLTKPAKSKQRKQRLPHTPNYVTIRSPGDILRDKIGEMGIETVELAKQMKVPLEIVEQLLRSAIPLSEELAQRIEIVTQMPAAVMMRAENRYREKLISAMLYPEIPAYWGESIINRPTEGHVVCLLQEISGRLARIERELKVQRKTR